MDRWSPSHRRLRDWVFQHSNLTKSSSSLTVKAVMAAIRNTLKKHPVDIEGIGTLKLVDGKVEFSPVARVDKATDF